MSSYLSIDADPQKQPVIIEQQQAALRASTSTTTLIS
jgi:hypothetical protein